MECCQVNFPGVSVNVVVRNSVDTYVNLKLAANSSAAADKFEPLGRMHTPTVSVWLVAMLFAPGRLYRRLRQ